MKFLLTFGERKKIVECEPIELKLFAKFSFSLQEPYDLEVFDDSFSEYVEIDDYSKIKEMSKIRISIKNHAATASNTQTKEIGKKAIEDQALFKPVFNSILKEDRPKRLMGPLYGDDAACSKNETRKKQKVSTEIDLTRDLNSEESLIDSFLNHASANGFFDAYAKDQHFGIVCKSCKQESFTGKRYRCVICNALNICERCFKENVEIPNHERNHPLVCFVAPGQAFQQNFTLNNGTMEQLKQDYSQYKNEGVNCDGCMSSNFIGMRFQCFECDEYDLCYRCYISKIETLNHKSSHQLLFTSSKTSTSGACKSCMQSPLGTCKACLLKIGNHCSDPVMREIKAIENSIFNFSNAFSTYGMEHLDSSTKKYLHFIKHYFENVKTLYSCNVCKSNIIGIRIECYECESYDLCFRCYDRGAVTEKHQLNHRLLIPELHFNLTPTVIKLEKKTNISNGVFKSIHTLTNKTIACKFISKPTSANKLGSYFQSYSNEFYKCCRIKSEFIVKQLGYFHETKVNTIQFCLAKEYMDKKDLYSLFHAENDMLSLKHRLKMACNISSGLLDLHERNIIHRNLTPAKIVVNSEYKAKLSDLGMSEANDEKELALYMPKEFHSKNYNNKLDIYSFGLILYFIFTGKRPQLMEDSIYLPEKILIFSELVHKCSNEVPSQRPDIKYIENNLNLHYSAILKGTHTALGYASFDKEKREKIFIKLYKYVSKKTKNS